MCARRFLLAIFWMTLLIVGGAFAIFQFGGDVLIKSTIPKGHFAPPPPDSRPDYTQADTWIAQPGLPDDPSRWLPDGATVSSTANGAAIFYIHPTTYLQRDRWNALLQPDAQTEFRTRLFVQTQGSAFNTAGDVWAPRYRQAAYGSFLLDNTDARAAIDLAYSDVERAFGQFLAGLPADQPIILAGHSQGALHLMRLLRDRVAEQPIRDRV